MKLTIDEFVDYKHLLILEGLLERNIEYKRLNLPSRDTMLAEVKSEISRLESLDAERRREKK